MAANNQNKPHFFALWILPCFVLFLQLPETDTLGIILCILQFANAKFYEDVGYIYNIINVLIN